MGAYANCWIGNLVAVASKNTIDPNVLAIFDRKGRVVRRSDDTDLPDCIRTDISDEEDEPFDVVYLETTTRIARDRLELAGFTLETARRLFDESMTLGASDSPRYVQFSVDKWMAYQRYLSGRDCDGAAAELGGDLLQLLETDGVFVDECPDPSVLLRLTLEICPDAETILYNLTNLIRAEELREDEDPFDYMISTGLGHTVVLTEGRTDSWILKDSLQLLYPHLAGNFSFMEFSEFRAGGGAGNLANLVKSFAAAGTLNRTIAVFDNDTAAAAALASIRTIKLPVHIVIIQLPELPTLQAYPTIGPTGPANMDVNGIAASIEVYLGNDVLRDEQSCLPPIQWTGYENSIGKYQGELIGKAAVQERFKQKLDRARNDGDFLQSADWVGIRKILEGILSAFHELDAKLLSRQLKSFYDR